jgi:hypothetical protein
VSVVAFCAALLIGGYKLIKAPNRAVSSRVWPAEPGLVSTDPLERAEAARLAGEKYGGGK